MSDLVKPYQHKPLLVEACKWAGDESGMYLILSWIIQGGGKAWVYPQAGEASAIAISTLEGVMLASPGDYIIRGIQGEFYRCGPDIFDKTYDEKVAATTSEEN